MENKKLISQTDVINLYMDYILRHNKKPDSVYAFTKSNDFKEQKFYEFFGSFEALEQSIFKVFFDNTFSVLEKSKDYLKFNSRNRLLSFYHTFFEILTINRNYLVQVLEDNKNSLKSLKMIYHLKKRFTNYIEHLDIKTIGLNQKQLVKFQNIKLKESAWLQLLLTIEFWLDDTSSSFEKTNLFIEKSVHVSIDIIDSMPIKSIVDYGYGKVLNKERMQIN